MAGKETQEVGTRVCWTCKKDLELDNFYMYHKVAKGGVPKIYYFKDCITCVSYWNKFKLVNNKMPVITKFRVRYLFGNPAIEKIEAKSESEKRITLLNGTIIYKSTQIESYHDTLGEAIKAGVAYHVGVVDSKIEQLNTAREDMENFTKFCETLHNENTDE